MLTSSASSQNVNGDVNQGAAPEKLLKICSTQEIESSPFFKLLDESGLKKSVVNEVEHFVCDV